VQEYLTARRHWWMRCQSGAYAVEPGGGKRRYVAFGRPGMADILALPDLGVPSAGEIIPTWIETKAPDGRQAKAQRLFQLEVEPLGHIYILARCVEDLIAHGL